MKERIGRYEIRQEIGRGGMATVYQAVDPRFNRLVALKVLPRQYTHDPKYIDRFELEAKMIARLEHPAIVPVYDYGEHDDAPYLVMRYMSGGSLAGRLHDEPLPLAEIEAILDRVAPALDYAHKFGIVHRDVKPANIFFDDENRAYLADFGIARMQEASQSTTGIIGTAAYISPEQVARNHKIDGRSDVYALGVVLYELLTGDIPYPADTNTQKMMAHVLEPVPDVLKANTDLPPAAQEVIDRAMAKEPDDRYPTAAALFAGLKTLSAAPDVTATAPAIRTDKTEVETAVPLHKEPPPVVIEAAAGKTAEAEVIRQEPPPAVEPQPEKVYEERSETAVEKPAPKPQQAATLGAAATRSRMVIIMVTLAVIAGILALIDAGRYVGAIDLSGELPWYGYVYYDYFDRSHGAFLSLGVGIAWFFAAYWLWSRKPAALRLVRGIAVANLFIVLLAVSSGTNPLDMLWASLVNIALIVLSFLPAVQPAYGLPASDGRSFSLSALWTQAESAGEAPAGQTTAPWWLAAVEGGLLLLIAAYLLFSGTGDWDKIYWLIGFYFALSGLLNFAKLTYDRSQRVLKIIAGICGFLALIFLLQNSFGTYISDEMALILAVLGFIIGSSNLIQGMRGAGRSVVILGAVGILSAVFLLDYAFDWYFLRSPQLYEIIFGLGGLAALTSAFRSPARSPTLELPQRAMWPFLLQGIIALLIGLVFLLNDEGYYSTYLALSGLFVLTLGVFILQRGGGKAQRVQGIAAAVVGVMVLLLWSFLGSSYYSIWSLLPGLSLIIIGGLGLFASFKARGDGYAAWGPLIINSLLLLWGVLSIFSRLIDYPEESTSSIGGIMLIAIGLTFFWWGYRSRDAYAGE